MNAEQIKELYKLLNDLREGIISNADFERLDLWISRDKHVCQVYVDFMKLWAELQCFQAAANFNCSSLITESQQEKQYVTDLQLWSDLAEYEIAAPAIEIPDEKPQEEIIPKVIYPSRNKHKITRLDKIVFIAAAAMFLFVVFLKYAPQKPNSVARLNRMVNAKWGQGEPAYYEGQLLYPEAMTLLSGYVDLLLDNGATVIVEGPAEFTIEKPHRLFLNSGRLVVRVDSDSSDEVFVVRSPYNCVVDYGTEFGVQVDASGLETHVFEGKVDVREGTDPVKFLSSVSLDAGESAVAELNQPVRKTILKAVRYVRGDEFEIRYKVATSLQQAQEANLGMIENIPELTNDLVLGTMHSKGVPDSWVSNMVIDLASAYTNTSGLAQILTVENFAFVAGYIGSPVTPFVAQWVGDPNFVTPNENPAQFTVVAIGDTLTATDDYDYGYNAVAFSAVTTQITVDAGETIVFGFTNNYADGSFKSTRPVINYYPDPDGENKVWYAGIKNDKEAGYSCSISVGSPLTIGASGVIIFDNRVYSIQIGFSVE